MPTAPKNNILTARSFTRRALAATGVHTLGVLTSCGATTQAEDETPTVLATFTVLADIAQNIGGEHITLESLTKPGAEIHGYDPTPSDVKKGGGS